jgi:hypothetical protein
MHGITLLSAHSCAFAIDHTELELGEPTDQAQAKDLTHLGWIKASPCAFNQYSSFVFETSLCVLCWLLSVFSALARYIEVKITRSYSKVVLQATKHTIVYPGSGPSLEVTVLCPAV